MPIHEFRTRRRVEFADTDAGGIVHFARFFVFMETAEHELLRSVGIVAHATHDGRTIGWPRVAASCSYQSPARYGDELDIEVSIRHKGRSSMTYGFRVLCGERLVATGELKTVCCVMHEGGRLESIAMPAALDGAVAALPSP